MGPPLWVLFKHTQDAVEKPLLGRLIRLLGLLPIGRLPLRIGRNLPRGAARHRIGVELR